MSRLDRLVLLLDTGSPVVRSTAAEQLAQIQKTHAHELFNLLSRVVPYLRSPHWETRVASSKAIGGILDNAALFDPDSTDYPKNAVVAKIGAVSQAESEDTRIDIKLEPEAVAIDDSNDVAHLATTNGVSMVKKELTIKTGDAQDMSVEDEKLSFRTFDIIHVVRNGKALLGSAGREYDFNMAALSPEERLARAKHNVASRLGLGAEYMENDFLSAHDLATPAMDSPSLSPRAHPSHISMPPPTALQSENSPTISPGTSALESGLSARQRNMMKRKAKTIGKESTSKVRVVDVSGASNNRRASVDHKASVNPTPLRQETSASDYFSITPQAQNESKIVVEHKLPAASSSIFFNGSSHANAWPFDTMVDLLIVDLFDPKWETRHGAAMALREVLRSHGHGAGRVHGLSREVNDELNRVYLDDLACRLCCIFALDRFGDYVADQVVAPIREVVSQTLAALLLHLPEESVYCTFRLLSALVLQPTIHTKAWEITHGGMLGMKYLVAVRKDLLVNSSELLDGVVSAVLYGLADHDDDVRAVSAATLIPIANEFVEYRAELLGSLLDVLWNCLADLSDDLSASTGSIMDLLSKLCSIPKVLQVMREKSIQESNHTFSMLVPRLFPFLRHTITSVRRAVLRALQTFLLADELAAVDFIDTKLFRLVLQNILLEQHLDIHDLSFELWQTCVKAVSKVDRAQLYSVTNASLADCLALTMTPIGSSRFSIPLDLALLIRPSGQTYLSSKSAVSTATTDFNKARPNRRKIAEYQIEAGGTHNVDAPMLQGDVELVKVDTFVRTRTTAAMALGFMLGHWPEDRSQSTIQAILHEYSTSTASSPRFLVASLLQTYLESSSDANEASEIRIKLEQLMTMVCPTYYSNHIPLLHVVRSQCQALCNGFTDQGHVPLSKIPALPILCKGEPNSDENAFDLAIADKLVGEDYERLRKVMSTSYKGPIAKYLEDARDTVISAMRDLRRSKLAEDTRILASYGGAFVAIGILPRKLNPVIKVLMDSIKTEAVPFLQRRSANSLVSLVRICSRAGRGSAAEKLIKNLCAFLCIDASQTPEFQSDSDLRGTIYSLRIHDITNNTVDEGHEVKVKYTGSLTTLEQMAIRFGVDLFKIAPTLRAHMLAPLAAVFDSSNDTTIPLCLSQDAGQELIDGLSVLRALVGKLEKTLLPEILSCTPLLLRALHCEYASVRYIAAECFAAVCSTEPISGFDITITKIIPMLADASALHKRQGAIETIHLLVVLMDVRILPYVIFLIVPVLGRMSDSNNDIRIIATTTFALLVKLVPLEAGIADPPGLSAELLQGRDTERKFIQQMLDGSKVEPFEIPVAIKADLRSYQQEGVNWLAFLNKYQLHGVLCDDMGLGKTLQTICIVASDHHNRRLKYKETSSSENRQIPSLIICPPSLSGHWQHEIQNYAPFLSCVTYVGYPPERRSLQAQLSGTDVVITSYDIARNDIEFLSAMDFNYCVLDEGHIIKNAKAKLTQSVKLIKANHRLILSGTPIQNNVLELWSLFDFLMPGFLGTEKSFYDRYAKPIANSRDSKTSSKEQEAGALALEALHKQVLPFLLRRLKEDVLADLPPKIIQDYYCDLSPLQKALYTEFTASQSAAVVRETSSDMKKEAKSHVFQALQYMRKLCNHPALVLNAKHPKYKVMMSELSKDAQDLRDIQHAPKFMALRDLLLDCGIGARTSDTTNGRAEAAELSGEVVNQHRALIFCQLKDMLDMVESDVLKKLLPTVSYMRLDGTTDPRHRQRIVQEFNADPSIDVLLLTTHVGGLGLNLTGADTVIFVEHDWNPMKDLQAMDRAHRIGQKNTVNVYRLITRGTLEEKIMGLQKFKINIASTIVNQQNAGLATMETDQILDLFNVDASMKQKTATNDTGLDSQGNLVRSGQKSVFDDLDDLHNETEYDDFNLESFVQTL